jgi:hypothetical protein
MRKRETTIPPINLPDSSRAPTKPIEFKTLAEMAIEWMAEIEKTRAS